MSGSPRSPGWSTLRLRLGGWLLVTGFLLVGLDTVRANWNFALILQTAEQRYGALGPAKGRIEAWNQMLQSEIAQPEREQLGAVNSFFNQQLSFQDDPGIWRQIDYWATPVESLIKGAGDCEDYALAKRRALIDAGWPASTLLMSVVKQADGEGHAVLLVRTDRGDLVLDNQVGTIDLWNQTPYKFIKRQSQANAGQWVDMIDGRDIQIITAAIK